MTRDAKTSVLFYLDPLRRFEEALQQEGFPNVDMEKIEEPDVWELKTTCPSKLRCRTSSEITKRLRRIAQAAHCAIAPGMLVAVVSHRKVTASLKAPPIGQPA